jgi:hypothetical protein
MTVMDGSEPPAADPITEPSREDSDGAMTLPRLVNQLRGDRSYRDLEAATGGVVGAQRWNQIANGQRLKEFPSVKTLTAMAAALPCDPYVLLMACARSVGVDVGNRKSRFVELMPPAVDDLPESTKVALAAFARMLAENDRS